MRAKSKDAFRSVLIFGGAGFIGSNWAHRLLTTTDAKVHVFDNLSRLGVRHNLNWLQKEAGRSGRLQITIGDIRDQQMVERACRNATEIYHFAAQVAVTTSVTDPRHDMEVNIGGTFNVLEGARKSGNKPFLLFTSTNKVYGEMPELKLRESSNRWDYAAIDGVSEAQHLDFHSPYGCSKGAADQYVHDYARIYDLPTTVFRMSCIAGTRQFGNEDQGWVAHFLFSAILDRPLVVYGDGKQVRDVLFVEDLMNAFDAARQNQQTTGGEIYNVGGGKKNAVSLMEVIASIEEITNHRVKYVRDEPRPGDQLVYVTDHSKLTRDTGWTPQATVRQTLERMTDWCRRNRDLFIYPAPTVTPAAMRPQLVEIPRTA